MRLTLIAAFSAAIGASITSSTSTECARDNCLRAIVASNFPTRPGTADCSSYFRKTVTPATITNTATATVSATATVTDTVIVGVVVTVPATITVTVDPGPLLRRDGPYDMLRHPLASTLEARQPAPTLEARQQTVAPSRIPAYASPCSGAVRYSSACSCIGVRPTTITVAAPRTTVTATVTITNTARVIVSATSSSTTTVVATATAVACTSFRFQASGGGFGVDGAYAVVSQDVGSDYSLRFTPVQALATTFVIDAATGRISFNGLIGNVTPGNPYFVLYFNTPAEVAAAGYAPAVCSVQSGVLSCTADGKSVPQICPNSAENRVILGVNLRSDCLSLTLGASPQC